MPSDKKKMRGHRPERRISVRGVRREEPDLRKLAQALIAIAQAEAEAAAQAQHEARASDGVNTTRDGDVPKEAA